MIFLLPSSLYLLQLQCQPVLTGISNLEFTVALILLVLIFKFIIHVLGQVVLLIQSYCFMMFSMPSSLYLLKLPIATSADFGVALTLLVFQNLNVEIC